MANYSIGDQARSFILQSATGRMKRLSNTLLQELASREVADIGQRTGGNTSVLRSIEHRSHLTRKYQENIQEASISIKAMMDSLSEIQRNSSAMAVSIMTEPLAVSEAMIVERSMQGARELDLTLAGLNVAVGGEYLFSGVATDTPPFLQDIDLLTTLESVVSGVSGANNRVQAIVDWFDMPSGSGGFLDKMYSGSVEGYREISDVRGSILKVDLSASSLEMRETLKGLSIIGLTGRGVFGGDFAEMRNAMEIGGDLIYRSIDGLINAQARLGMISARLEKNKIENYNLLNGLEICINEIRAADPLETSMAIMEVEKNFEVIFSAVGRLANIKLVNYIR